MEPRRLDPRFRWSAACLRVVGPGLWRKLLAAAVLLSLSLGCTRSAVPYPGAVLPSTLTAAALAPRAPRLPYSGEVAQEVLHAVVGVAEGSVLTVRPVAGVEGSTSGTLAYDQRNLYLSGQQTALGSSIWVEILRPEGGTGWVNIQDLTEQVPADSFCADTRVLQLLDAVSRAVAERDGQALALLTSPRRGLWIRYDWRGPQVSVPPSDVPGLFRATTPLDWGVNSSGASIRGTFTEVVLPQLDKALRPSSVLTCDSIQTGSILRDVSWPSEYANLNFYSFYHPADEGASEYSWVSWLAGVEYVLAQPYLATLVLLRAGV